MRLGLRAVLTLLGSALVYCAFVAPSLAKQPADFHALGVSLALLAVTTASVAIQARRLALEHSYRGQAGAVAIVLFLINPVTVLLGLTGFISPPGLAALFAALFVAVWLSLEHWSLFMRSLTLGFLFAIGLACGASTTAWIVLALIPWVLFNRRPLSAVGFFTTVVGGGTLLYAVVWALYAFARHRPQEAMFPIQQIFTAVRYFQAPVHPLMESGLQIGFFWALLALGLAALRGRQAWLERRTDGAAFAALLVWIVPLVAIKSSEGINATFVALSAPFIAAEAARKEYLMSRGSRIAVAMGAAVGTACQWSLFFFNEQAGNALWISAAGVLVAGSLAYYARPTHRLPSRVRWTSVLIGLMLGSSLLTSAAMMLGKL